MITETITWTLLKDKWPEPGDATLSLVVSTDGEDGPEFSVEDGCICYEENNDPFWYTWFSDSHGESIVGVVHAWTYGPTGKGVIDALTAHLRPQIAPRNSLIPFESDLS
jgi:hypothetical protein